MTFQRGFEEGGVRVLACLHIHRSWVGVRGRTAGNDRQVVLAALQDFLERFRSDCEIIPIQRAIDVWSMLETLRIPDPPTSATFFRIPVMLFKVSLRELRPHR